MVKTVLTIDGMMCSMCEAHINDVIRKNFDVKSVTSSHSKGRTEIISESELDKALIEKSIAETGYTLQSVKTEPFEKKRFSLFKK
ncbi:MAG: cation transporter [Clostridia bacterium]|nr:cation transporter [Clostridia bacterium]